MCSRLQSSIENLYIVSTGQIFQTKTNKTKQNKTQLNLFEKKCSHDSLLAFESIESQSFQTVFRVVMF